MMFKRTLGFFSLTAFLLTAFVSPVQAEEGTVNAMSAWQSQGQLYKVGKNKGLFIGGFSGIMFVEDKKGALDANNLICPGTMDVNLDDGSVEAEGKCIITDPGGNTVFAEWQCEGVMMEGCIGTFDLVGGSGIFEGITGKSDFVIRSALGEVNVDMQTAVVQTTSIGLAFWPNLHYKFP